jgi:predicted negative regulator of RcsB-dependent stress response
MMSEKLIKVAEGKPSPALAEKLLFSMDKIMTTIPKNNEGGWQAMCLKLQGICLESKDDMKSALTCYNDALALDPKIGVKQRVNKIKKHFV